MIIKENITVYQCEFCKKKMFVKHAMENHINWCNCNPKNFNKCSEGCIHLEETTVGFYVDYGGDETRARHAKAFKCNKLDKMLYPLKAARKGLPEKYPETFEGQELMPKDCDQFDNGFGNIPNFIYDAEY